MYISITAHPWREPRWEFKARRIQRQNLRQTLEETLLNGFPPLVHSFTICPRVAPLTVDWALPH